MSLRDVRLVGVKPGQRFDLTRKTFHFSFSSEGIAHEQ